MPLAVHAIVVVPCYNEEKRLDSDAFRGFVLEGHRIEFLFVNDGSGDGTLRLLEALRAANPDRFSVVNLDPNRGKAEAVRQGILAAIERQPDAVAFWDADLATPLSELAPFLDALASRPNVDVVFGSRVRLLGLDIRRRPSRHYFGRVGATLISSSLGLAVYDTQCGAKLFRNTAAVREVFAAPFLSRWIFDVEIIARFIRQRGRNEAAVAMYELPVRVWHDVDGSKIRATDFVRALRDLWKIRRAYRSGK
jgi:dolichyl-phosphate beta-glucosyltransferase